MDWEIKLQNEPENFNSSILIMAITTVKVIGPSRGICFPRSHKGHEE